MSVKQQAGLGAMLLIGSWLMASAVVAQEAPRGDAAKGRKLAQACQTCHGIDGIGKMPNVPNIFGESEFYLTKQLKAFRSGGRKDELMTIVAEPLTDAEIANLAAWYASITFSVTVPPNGDAPVPSTTSPSP